jgi:hypothetical protein
MGEVAKVVCVCAPPLPEEKSITVTPTASPTSGGMATTTTLNVEVGISSPSITPTAKIIAVNESPGSKGRVLSAEGDEAIEDRVEGVANSTTDNVERSDTTSHLNTDRERDHASADNDKDTAHILSPVPNANAARSKKTNEMNVKLTAAYLGEEDSCNDAATNNAGPCELLPSKHHPFVEGSGSHSNFHNEFIRDQASRAAQLYQEKSNSFRASFIAKSDENVRVAIPVKYVFRTVSDENKDGVVDFGLGPMCKVGDGGEVVVHDYVDSTRQVTYRDKNGKTLFRAGLHLFNPWTAIKGNAGLEPVFYMDAVNLEQGRLRRFFFEFHNKEVLASALGHLFYDDMNHLTEFFVHDEMKNRFLVISKSIPDHIIKRDDSAMEVDIEVHQAPFIDDEFKGESQAY